METLCFDARIEFLPEGKPASQQVLLSFPDGNIPATLQIHPPASGEISKPVFVRIFTARPIDVHWRDTFLIRTSPRSRVRGEGLVLDPLAKKSGRNRVLRKHLMLAALSGDEKDMLLALTHRAGSKGLSEAGVMRFARISREELTALAQELESEGSIRILGFNPLLLLEDEAFLRLCRKIERWVLTSRKEKPDFVGYTADQIQERFRIQPKVGTLALRTLERQGHLKHSEGRWTPADFNLTIAPEEEQLLARLEEMLLKGELRSVSMQEVRRRLRLSSAKMDRLLLLLTERKKVVQGKDGWLIHSQWLDEVVSQIRQSGKSELSVAEFKRLTGLSRKYAIPLLELLDQMGITRRRGATREVL